MPLRWCGTRFADSVRTWQTFGPRMRWMKLPDDFTLVSSNASSTGKVPAPIPETVCHQKYPANSLLRTSRHHGSDRLHRGSIDSRFVARQLPFPPFHALFVSVQYTEGGDCHESPLVTNGFLRIAEVRKRAKAAYIEQLRTGESTDFLVMDGLRWLESCKS